MLSKITIIIAGFSLSACSFFQNPEINVTLNEWSGKKVYFVDLDPKLRTSFNFNKVWSKLTRSRFRYYFRFLKYPHTIIGLYETWDHDFLVIENRKGKRFKMIFDPVLDNPPELPSYLLTVDVLNDAKAMIGKTIWLNDTWDEAGFTTTSEYGFPRFDPVEVVDVIPFQNRHEDYPVWLKVKSRFGDRAKVRYNGEEGRVGIQDHYYTSNPLPKKWGKTMIKKVLRNEVEIDMTERQIRVSIGNPDEVNHTSSRHGMSDQWVYGTELEKKIYYQFEYGKLTFINR
jgi:hypothetical protein